MSDHAFERFCPLAEIPPGAKKARKIGDTPVLVCNNQGKLYAISALCSHQAKFITSGKVRNGRITCPMHGAQFSLESGQALCLPATKPIATFGVRVVDDWIEVCLSGHPA